MLKYWAYVLVSDDRTGKTTLQKEILLRLCGIDNFRRLDSNQEYRISNVLMPSSVKTLYLIGRSYDEQGVTASNHYSLSFHTSDIVFLSFHAKITNVPEIAKLFQLLRADFYNVSGVFFQNCQTTAAREIARLNWDEVIWLNNPLLKNTDDAPSQLRDIGTRFSRFLVDRARNHSGLG